MQISHTEDMVERLKSIDRKVLILAGVVLLFTILFGIVVFTSQNQKSSNQVNKFIVSPTPNNPQSNDSNATQNSSQPQVNGTTDLEYIGDGYTIDYPKDWQVQNSSLDNFNTITLSPNVTYIDPSAPTIILGVIHNSQISLADRIRTLTFVSYKKTTVLLGKISVVKLERELPPKTVNGIVYSPVINTHYMVEKNSVQFDIVTNYQKGDSDAKQLVGQIVQTLQLD